MAARLSLTQDEGKLTFWVTPTLPPACAAWHVPLTKYACWSGMSARLLDLPCKPHIEENVSFWVTPMAFRNCSKGMLDFFLVLRWRRCNTWDSVAMVLTYAYLHGLLLEFPCTVGRAEPFDSWVMALSWKFNHDYGKKSFDDFWKCSITNSGCQINIA